MDDKKTRPRSTPPASAAPRLRLVAGGRAPAPVRPPMRVLAAEDLRRVCSGAFGGTGA